MIEKTKQEIETRYRIENGYEHDATVTFSQTIYNVSVFHSLIFIHLGHLWRY